MAGILLSSSSRNAQCSSLCIMGTASSRPTILAPLVPRGPEANSPYSPRSVGETSALGGDGLMTLVDTLGSSME